MIERLLFASGMLLWNYQSHRLLQSSGAVDYIKLCRLQIAESYTQLSERVM